MSVQTLSELLEMFADPYQAKKTQKHNKCLRGIRGVAPGEIARILAQEISSLISEQASRASRSDLGVPGLPPK